jgi:NRAMP (natural resistance-associated macrophage protein)-like metal ion transporter
VSGSPRNSSAPTAKVKGSQTPQHWLGPGLITGASDDDPSGIATYSQVGAQFGYGLGWTMLFSFPLMAAIQQISARIGRVTGHGLAGNLCRHYPAWLLHIAVGLLLVANVINLGADLGAMGSAVELIIGGSDRLYSVGFGILCATLQIFMAYRRYVMVLKWLTLALFAYVAVVFAVDVPWAEVARATLWPDLLGDSARWTAVVAVFGTTISPYLFFWQSSQEAEDVRDDDTAKPLRRGSKTKAEVEFRRIRIDTYVGMAISNIIGFFIIVAAGATLHVNGITDIQTSAQAAEALRPIAGPLTMIIFALGIIGTGLLAVPVLAGSAAYALGEARKWPSGLGYLPREAKAFYVTIAVATAIGVALNFVNIDPIKALFWSAVINGVVAVPIMAVMMHMARRPEIMGKHTLTTPLGVVGWLATVVMAGMVAIMLWTSI